MLTFFGDCPIYFRPLLNSLAGGLAALKFSAFVVRASVYINFVIALAGFLVFYIKILQLDRARCADSQNSQDSSLSSFHFFFRPDRMGRCVAARLLTLSLAPLFSLFPFCSSLHVTLMYI